MSNKEEWYRQCRFETATPTGSKVETAWIPEQFAKVGKKIYLGSKTQTPTEIWVITEVYSRQRESFLIEHQIDYKHQRQMSDI